MLGARWRLFVGMVMQVANFAQLVRVLYAAFLMAVIDLNVVSVVVIIGWMVWIVLTYWDRSRSC